MKLLMKSLYFCDDESEPIDVWEQGCASAFASSSSFVSFFSGQKLK